MLIKISLKFNEIRLNIYNLHAVKTMIANE